MSEKINNLVSFLVNDKFVTEHPSYIAKLNDNDISLSNSWTKERDLFKIDCESNMGMLDFICETCQKVVEGLQIDEIDWSIETHRFTNVDDSINDGPIEIFFLNNNEPQLSLSFSSLNEKNRKWLKEYMAYSEFGEENLNDKENVDDFKKLDNFLKSLADSLENNANKEESNGVRHI